MLTANIEAVHRRYGILLGLKRVARLTQLARLRGATPRRYVVTMRPDPEAARPVDLVDRQIYTDGPDRLWEADITRCNRGGRDTNSRRGQHRRRALNL